MVTFNFPIRLGYTDRGVPHRRERGSYWLLIGQGSHLRASDCSVSDTNLLPSCCYPRHSDYSLWSYCKLMDTWLKQNLVRSDESHHTQSFLKLESGGWCPRTGHQKKQQQINKCGIMSEFKTFFPLDNSIIIIKNFALPIIFFEITSDPLIVDKGQT